MKEIGIAGKQVMLMSETACSIGEDGRKQGRNRRVCVCVHVCEQCSTIAIYFNHSCEDIHIAFSHFSFLKELPTLCTRGDRVDTDDQYSAVKQK